MDPWKNDTTIRLGYTKEIFLRIRTAVWNDITDEWEAGPYKDLTDHTFLAQIRELDGDALIETFTCAMGDQGDPVDGIGSLLMKITDEDTAALTGIVILNDATKYAYDLKVTEPDGDAFPYMEGNVTFKRGYSHA
jgi:hypothetical protein